MTPAAYLKRVFSRASKESVSVFQKVANGRSLNPDVVLSVNQAGNIVAEIMDAVWLKHYVEFSEPLQDLHEILGGAPEVEGVPPKGAKRGTLVNLLFIS